VIAVTLAVGQARVLVVVVRLWPYGMKKSFAKAPAFFTYS